MFNYLRRFNLYNKILRILNVFKEASKIKTLTFEENSEELKRLFIQYDTEDVIKALLTSNLWLPNSSSPIKHIYFLSVLLSIKEEKFISKKTIKTYEDLNEFLKNTTSLCPSFSMLEDYLLEQDWGEIKYSFNDKTYKIFYGNELELLFDFLTEFEMIHVSLDKQYRAIVNESPIEDMKFCLTIQDEIIKNINIDSTDVNENINPGHIEIPSEKFWIAVTRFVDRFHTLISSRFDERYIEKKSIKLGELREGLDANSFSDLVFHGSLITQDIIQCKNKYFPLLPRRCSSNLIDKWARIFNEKEEELKKQIGYEMHFYWGRELYKFIDKRCDSEYLFPMVNSQDKDGEHNSLIFHAAFLANDRLVLIHLASDLEKLKEVFDGIRVSDSQLKLKPMTIALNMDKKSMQLVDKDDNKTLKPLFITLLADFDPSDFHSIPIDEKVGLVFGLRHFLAIFDECKDENDFVEFLEYEEAEEIKTPPLVSITDRFGAYKDSHAVMFMGARNPDYYVIDPHWGSALRYKSLKEFWKLYPESGFFGDPRTWRVKKESKTRVRLTARGMFCFALYTNVSGIDIFSTAPFDEMSYEQGELSNFLMECLEDSINHTNLDLSDIEMLNSYKHLQVTFFPNSLAKSNDKFRHLNHLICNKDECWKSDMHIIDSKYPMIRFVFNDELIVNKFSTMKNNDAEIELLIEFLNILELFGNDKNIEKCKKMVLENFREKTPRFKLFQMSTDVQFPRFVKFYRPSIREQREIRREVAKLASSSDIKPGTYELVEGKKVLNKLKSGLVKQINDMVEDFDFKDSICQLIPMIDSMIFDFKKERISLNNSLLLDVDFQRETKLSDAQEKFNKLHKNYRYLIEKFVQISPKGKRKLTNRVIKVLLALVDEIHLLQEYSDTMNYSIFPTKVEITEDFIFSVIEDEGYSNRQKEYSEKRAKYDLGIYGNKEDKVRLSDQLNNMMEEISIAFQTDVGFRLDNYLNVLDVLSGWASFSKEKKIDSYYYANYEDIETVCIERLKDFKKEELKPILNYMVLRKENVLKVMGNSQNCPDLPIWEISKREHRYILKPLITIDNLYYWGAYSTDKARDVWFVRLSLGGLPYTIETPNVSKVMEKYKEMISVKLVDQTYVVLKRFTKYCEKNLYLHKRDRKYPDNLGDYDGFAYLETSNIILNIECKDLLLPFCLKDAKRLRERIFGTDKDRAYLEKIENRERFLIENYLNTLATLGWQTPKEPPRVVSIYVSRDLFWWTEFPPYSTNVKFIRIDALEEFIKRLQ